MAAPNISGITRLNRTSCIVNWEVSDANYSFTYTVSWINLNTSEMEGSVTVSENTNSQMLTEFNGNDNYNVSVTATCGMMMSEPMTVYGKN